MSARRFAAGLPAVLALAVAAPAMAAIPHEGWYGALDVALTQPAGLDQQYATLVDRDNCGGNCTETERLILDNDDAFTWGAAFGYSFGKMGALQVSYWGFGNNDGFSDSGVVGEVYPTLAGYTQEVGIASVYGFAGYPAEFEAESDTRATLWDIDYVRPMAAGDKFSVNWLAGLRVAEYRENVYWVGDDTYFGDMYSQDKHITNHGWGFKVGASANMDFTKTFGIVADLAVSFLQAESKGNASNCEDTCGNDQDDIEGNDDSQRGEIRDYGLQAIWHQGPVDIFAGFRSSNWEGIVSDPVPAVLAGVGQSAGDREDVTFNSWHAGVKWKIGG